MAGTIPNCRSYDPCFSYELETIISEGIDDMYVKNNDRYYYITLMNENYIHPERPDNATPDNIMKGAYCFFKPKNPDFRVLASGLTLNFALDAQDTLNELGIEIEIWSVTSFNELYKDGIESERNERYFNKSAKPYVSSIFNDPIPTLAVSEYQRAYANQIRRWSNAEYIALGTDGFGRSDTREKLRDFFEIDANHIVLNILKSLKKETEFQQYMKENKISFSKEAPWKR
jgi:pyruvate dehydrogenase E1 component